MALLNKLYIQGIRSFGFDKENEQKIEFTSPVTVITGENGSGKTAIIECLKYAITGDLPSGSDRGKYFVHDSSLYTIRTEIHGKVKLTVSNSQNEDTTVSRSLKLHVTNNNKRESKGSEVSIITHYNNGEFDHMNNRTNKIDDLNNYMCETMGVSKSILNNVIFCHQEDSNWPLDEGKKLKEKFDTIFGTTQYNKAIDKIIKMRKEYEKQLKEIEKDVGINKEIMEQVNKIKNKIEELKTEYDDNEKEITELSEALKPLEEENVKISKLEDDYKKLLNEKLNSENLYQTKKDEFVKLSERISNTGELLDDNLETMKVKQSNFVIVQKEQEIKKESLENECKELKVFKEEKRNNLMVLNGKFHEFTNEFRRLLKLLEIKSQKLQEMCSKLNISFDSENNKLIEDIKQNIQKEEEERLTFLKIETKKDEVFYQQNIDELREERTKLETNITAQKKSIKEKSESIEKILQEILKIEEEISKFNEAQQQIETAERKLKEINESNNMTVMKNNQVVLQDEISKLEEDQTKLDKIIETLFSVSQLTNEFESKQKEIVENQNEFEFLKNNLSSIFNALFSNMEIDSNFHAHLQAKQTELKDIVNDMKIKLKEKQHEKDRLNLEWDNMRYNEEKLENEIQIIKENIQNLCGDEDFLDVLEAQKEKVAKINLDLALLESSKIYNNDYIEKINQNPCCPLCSRGLKNEEAEILTGQLRENINQLPEKIATIHKVLQTESIKLDQLNEIKPSYENLKELVKEKFETEEKTKELEQKINKIQETIDSNNNLMLEPKQLCELITTNVLTETMKLDNLQQGIINRTKEIENIKLKMPQNITEMTLTEALEKRKENSGNMKLKKESIKKIENKIQEINENFMNLREELNNLQIQKNEFQNKLQEVEKLKEENEKFIKDKNYLEEELKVFEHKIESLKIKLEDLLQKKKIFHEDREEKIQEQQLKLNQLKIDETEIENLNK